MARRLKGSIEIEIEVADEEAVRPHVHEAFLRMSGMYAQQHQAGIVSDFADTPQQAADFVAQDLNTGAPLLAFLAIQRGAATIPGAVFKIVHMKITPIQDSN